MKRFRNIPTFKLRTLAMPLYIHKLAILRSSDLNGISWQTVLKELAKSQQGAIVIIRHHRAEAIILTVGEYERLLGLAARQRKPTQDVLVGGQ